MAKKKGSGGAAGRDVSVNIETELAGVKLRNPLVLASGIWGTSAPLLVRAAAEGAGAVTSKSCCLNAQAGNRNPTVIASGECIMNAVGLSNPGAGEMEQEIKEAVKGAAAHGAPVIASFFGHTVSEYGEVAAIVARARPALLEVNASCPNLSEEGRLFSSSEADVQAVTYAVKDGAGAVPVFVKLSPNVDNIGKIARAAVEAGADGITAINTVRGMLIDPVARRPILTNKTGGVSGPAIKPVALRCVYEIRKAVGAEVPIIGVGGVRNGWDAAEMLIAGANAVGIGSALFYRGDAFREIGDELMRFMKNNGHAKLSELKLIE